MKKILKFVSLSSLLMSTLSIQQPLTILAQNESEESTNVGEEASTEDESSLEEASEESAEEEIETEESEETQEENSNSDEETEASSEDWSQIEKDIQETMKAKNIEQVYASSEPRQFEENDLITSLDAYAYYKVEDFGRDFKIQYGQTDIGGVLVMKVRMENNSGEAVYYNNAPDVNASNPSAMITQSDSMIGGHDYEGYLPLGTDVQELPAGESTEGLLTYYVTPEAMELIEADGTVLVEFIGFRNQLDFSGAEHLLNNPEFLLPLSKDAEETATASGEQYPDNIVSDNIGTKNVIEQEDTDASQEEEDLVVAVSGYEISEVVPNAANEESFKDYPGGVISINVKMDVTNNSEDQVVDLGGVYSSIVFGEQVQVKSNGFVQANDSEATVEPGETGTTYQVFTVDGDLWEKYKKDSLMIVPSIKDKEYEDMHDYQAIALMFKEA